MKKVLLILTVIFLFVRCDNAADCMKSTGPMVSKNFSGLEFRKILINKNIALVLKQGEMTTVEVVSGENLVNDIEVTLDNGMLTFKDNTSCNWTRDYGQTTVYITAPDITDIYSKTEQNITSDGILSYKNLRLVAMDGEDQFDGAATGDFVLQVSNETLIVEGNTISQFHLSGNTLQLNASFYSGNGILEAGNLLANKIHIFHRGSNDMFVHPLNEISGDIYNLGNVYAAFRPEIVNVNEHYRGKLFFD